MASRTAQQHASAITKLLQGAQQDSGGGGYVVPQATLDQIGTLLFGRSQGAGNLQTLQLPSDSIYGSYAGASIISKPATKTGATGLGAAGAVPAQALTGGLFSSVSDAINSTSDFLKFIGWIFHPRNILRAVEFLVGIALMIFGFHAAMQARGEKLEGFATSEGALTRSGLGRVATELGRATRQGRSPDRPRSAPHRTRQRALQQRYLREEDVQRRRAKAPRPKKKP